ncbi:hypothetical protein PAECIP111892_03932 [Paenibacillus auburnensis]|uniref:Uncharacterized protein n=1 Tax=Paenibacillus auburnensis TaxID=2905649 RepID=A0ABM9CIL7_9BACL|nr:hypothetical protein [Paenibacillus auburnensis]CAH1213926.1 hypothetical protein PAECIP111892_03932 [Paenibacillus auburnensis]
MSKLENQNQQLAKQLNQEKKKEQAATAKAKQNDPGDKGISTAKPAATSSNSSKPNNSKSNNSILNTVANGAKKAAVGTFNFLIGDDLKATFGKNSTVAERLIGGASLTLFVATFGEGKVLTSGVKALVQGADKLLMKNLAETAIVKEGVQVAKSNAVSQSAKAIEKSAANEAKQVAGSTTKQLSKSRWLEIILVACCGLGGRQRAQEILFLRFQKKNIPIIRRC